MHSFILLLFVIIVFGYYIYPKLSKYLNSVSIKSTVDGKYYTVRDISNKQQSADTLAEINKRVETLFEFLNTKECDNCSSYQDNINLMRNRYKYTEKNLTENTELQDTSFTIDKQEVNMCLATRDSNNDIYDINKLMYIFIHELSHVGCESVGHNDEFKHFFHFLAKQSVKCGILKYVNYSAKNEEYCGIQLTNNILD